MTPADTSTPLHTLAHALRRTQRFNRHVECALYCVLWLSARICLCGYAQLPPTGAAIHTARLTC